MSDEIPTKSLVDLDDALGRLASLVQPIRETVEVPLRNALGYVTATEVRAPYALPPFDNTGVDGYAFRHTEAMTGTLSLMGESLAGAPYEGEIPLGYAVHIATGAVLPQGTDTVAMQEHVKVDGSMITIDPLPPACANIRRRGADIEKGASVIKSGHRLRPQDIALLSALGLTSVKVVRRLRIGVLSTGTELREAGATLSAGQIIDTNSLMLKQLLVNYAADVEILPALADDRGATDALLKDAALSHDVIISTGGVSVGRKDYIRDALLALGKVHFWKLALRPGKPVMFGQIGNCWMLGLPGNPVSVMVTFYLVGRGLLQALSGQAPLLPMGFPVCLTTDVKKERHLRSFPRARLEGIFPELKATAFHDQSSNLLTSLVASDGVLDLPIGPDEIKAGTTVLFRPFESLQ